MSSNVGQAEIGHRKAEILAATGPAVLAQIMDIGVADPRIWRPEELAAIARHQLSAPVQFDLGAVEGRISEKLKAVTSGEGLLLRSLDDLLHHPHPPVELLELTKQFAKACWHHPDSPLPPEVAALLYCASIAVALVRCGERITSRDDAELRQHFTWFLQQSWVDEATESLFREAIDALGPPEPIPGGATQVMASG